MLNCSGFNRHFQLCFFLGGYGVERNFQQYFSYIEAVSFIGGGSRENSRHVASH